MANMYSLDSLGEEAWESYGNGKFKNRTLERQRVRQPAGRGEKSETERSRTEKSKLIRIDILGDEKSFATPGDGKSQNRKVKDRKVKDRTLENQRVRHPTLLPRSDFPL